jgi:hypothetical protein
MKKTTVKIEKTPQRKSVRKLSNNDDQKKKAVVTPPPKGVSLFIKYYLCSNFTE